MSSNLTRKRSLRGHDRVILVALGSNLESPQFGGPRQTLEAALGAMPYFGITVRQRSSWYSTAPVPASDQPWFVNGVALVETKASPAKLLALLHEIEAQFGRRRRSRNENRILDLDLLEYNHRVCCIEGGLQLPHPKIAQRAFVLHPLEELVPEWRHPLTDRTPAEMIQDLREFQSIRRLT